MIVKSTKTLSNISGQAFKVKTNAKAFRIISDGLYSNKPQSMVRELVSNAVDSHTRANNPKPVSVSFPTELNPYFTVKDYGVGLSEEEVFNVYTTYFESTKDQSNDEIGGFGLGSKTPFAVANSFTIIAGKNGVESEYLVYLKNDIPSITKVRETPSLYQGLTVKVPCDTNTLPEEYINQVKYMNVNDNVRDTPAKLKSKKAYQQLKKRGYLRASDACLYTYGICNVVIGSVLYTDVIDNTDLAADVTLYFDIGELELTASREEILSKSKEVIKQRLKDLCAVEADQAVQATTKLKRLPSVIKYMDNLLFKSSINFIREHFTQQYPILNIMTASGNTHDAYAIYTRRNNFHKPMYTQKPIVVYQAPFKHADKYKGKFDYLINKKLPQKTLDYLFGSSHTLVKPTAKRKKGGSGTRELIKNLRKREKHYDYYYTRADTREWQNLSWSLQRDGLLLTKPESKHTALPHLTPYLIAYKAKTLIEKLNDPTTVFRLAAQAKISDRDIRELIYKYMNVSLMNNKTQNYLNIEYCISPEDANKLRDTLDVQQRREYRVYCRILEKICKTTLKRTLNTNPLEDKEVFDTLPSIIKKQVPTTVGMDLGYIGKRLFIFFLPYFDKSFQWTELIKAYQKYHPDTTIIRKLG